MKNGKLKILVTGGAGFIGSNIVDAYIKENHQVTIIDNLSSGKKSNINKDAEFYKVDIRDTKKIIQIFKKGNFDIVNHHAAQIDVRRSVADPGFDADVNILGTLNILENSYKYGVQKIIFASSGGVIYGECQGDFFPDEESASNPLSPYGITKLAVEYYLKYYKTTYNIKYSILRYGNVYGPRQDPFGEAGVVAIFSQAMLNNKDAFIFGDGNQVRDYIYVQDVMKVNLLCLNSGDNEIFNIGTGVETSVNNLFDELRQITGYKKSAVYKPPRTGELFRSCLNTAKARQKLNWVAETDIKKGLEKTVNWFISHSS